MSEQNLIAFACLISFITMASAYIRLRSRFGIGMSRDLVDERHLESDSDGGLVDSMTARPTGDVSHAVRTQPQPMAIRAVHE